ncbi:TetR/AcrR family transcriptional regulator [Rhodococcus sp. D-46]|jgi:AcrR family transcriptional regulator|uniref:TetR family transcriptional regulator n=1 Tax=Rhodococcus erythropolis TaxID=1833 RepID=A0A6G9D428_RHOER|nr:MULTISPECIES: TetR family transcriptional regulator [Rhodococcus]NHE69063.1 TetR/AcrR family transcriptional regulator [Rhodococcus sp. D-46]EQM29801.1 TetR family transcriptional regulator [Rhodococcus erythropolis DN1]MBF7737684.1 TetR family transcriptional regulator [Rhodococcus erythropolis]MCD2136274.1 TetR/AcrR family transcriptional regulator [Rhodococcus qingshengii]MCJ0901636.1 TetR/AcrR family transcriptional regulator [Rhodococcus sp. ARC_M13]
MVVEPVRVSFRLQLRAEALRAAQELAIEKGWEKVRFSEIAAVIGVSRPTLYREFASKAALGDALVVRETHRFLDGIRKVLDANAADVPTAITAAVRYTLDEAVESPLLGVQLGRSDDLTRMGTGVLPLLATSTNMLKSATEELVTWIQTHLRGDRAADVVPAVDVWIRLTVSHLVLPGSMERCNQAVADQISLSVLRYLGLR